MNNLFKKFVEFAMGNLIVLIVGLLSTSIVSRIITPAQNGKNSMFVTTTSLLVLVITMGMDQAYIRYYNDEEEKNRGVYLKKCLYFPLMITCIVGVIGLIFYKPISNYIVKETSFLVVVLLFIHTIFMILSNFALINVRMKQKGKIYSFVSAMNKVSYLAFVFLFYVIFGDNYKTLIIALIFGNLVMLILSIYFEKSDWVNFKSEGKLKTSTKDMLKYGYPFIFSMAIIWIFQSIDKVTLRSLSTFEEVGLYSGAMTIVGLLNTLQGAFTTFWTPVAYEKFSKNPEDKNFFSNMNEIVSLAMLIISILLIAGKDIIILLLGSEYREAKFIFPFLVFMPIMYTISETTVLGINFYKKTKYHIYIAIFSAVANIIGNLILVPKMGATGAAISTGLAYIVFFISRTYFSGKFYKIKFKLFKFFICVVAIYGLAIYSSLNILNMEIILLTIFSLVLVMVMYNNIIREIFKLVKKFIIK